MFYWLICFIRLGDKKGYFKDAEIMSSYTFFYYIIVNILTKTSYFFTSFSYFPKFTYFPLTCCSQWDHHYLTCYSCWPLIQRKIVYHCLVKTSWNYSVNLFVVIKLFLGEVIFVKTDFLNSDPICEIKFCEICQSWSFSCSWKFFFLLFKLFLGAFLRQEICQFSNSLWISRN